ncbi:hypothetical protein BH24ACT4_BH24ACT4_13240 [soil metagenome]
MAVIGSVFNSVYLSALKGGAVVEQLPDIARQPTEDSVGAAQLVADQLPPPGVAPAYLGEVSNAFLSGLGLACLVTAGVAAAGAAFAARFLPAREAEAPPPAPSEPPAATAVD